MDPIGVKTAEAFKAVGIGKTKGWELIALGELQTYKVGSATLVTTESIRAYVQRQLEKQQVAT